MVLQEEQQLETGLSIIRRALLVEDNVACERVMSCYVSDLGYQVDCAGNATTAIQKISSKIYELIVLDLRLPDRYGTDVLQAVRQSELNLDTILLIWSAHLNKKDHEEYLARGADSILPKPCTAAYLKKVIKKCSETPKYQRKFYFQLKLIQEKWQCFLEEATEIEEIDYFNRLKRLLYEALAIIEEHQQWLNFQIKQEQPLE